MKKRFHLLAKGVNANDDFEIWKLLRDPQEAWNLVGRGE